MKPFIIPFFVNHQGCPHQCLYCDQRISGGRREEPVSAETVIKGILAGLASKRLRPDMKVEAAFFGGTFTAMSMARQEELLGAVQPFISDRRVHGLRLSTRPDALSAEQVEYLRSMRVTTIEIGAQSMDDQVLAASRRGHTAEDTLCAAQRVKEAGFDLGMQLLLGLPGESEASRKTTLEKILLISPNEVRLYPLLVFRNTPLAGWYEAGKYQTLTLSETVKTSAMMLKALTRTGIAVIRIGLQGSAELTEGLIAGPFHPALGHLVKAELFYQAMVQVMRNHPPNSEDCLLTVSSRDISQALGLGRSNKARLTEELRLPGLTFQTARDWERGRFRWQGEDYSIYD